MAVLPGTGAAGSFRKDSAGVLSRGAVPMGPGAVGDHHGFRLDSVFVF